MPTVETVNMWITLNLLDSEAWIKSDKQPIALIQAIRNLSYWYPETVLTDELVSYQVVWELQGLDPALKYQKQGVKAVSDSGERIDYTVRSKVAPDILDLLGIPAYEIQEEEQESPLQYGGFLV